MDTVVINHEGFTIFSGTCFGVPERALLTWETGDDTIGRAVLPVGRIDDIIRIITLYRERVDELSK